MIDIDKKLVTHSLENGRTKHYIGNRDRSDIFEARCDWEFFDGEDVLAVVLPGVSASTMNVIGEAVNIAWRGSDNIEFVQDGDFLRWKLTLNEKPSFTSADDGTDFTANEAGAAD